MKAVRHKEHPRHDSTVSVSEWVRLVLALLESHLCYSWEGTDEHWPQHFGHFNRYMGLFLRTLVQLLFFFFFFSLQQPKSQVDPYSGGRNKQKKTTQWTITKQHHYSCQTAMSWAPPRPPKPTATFILRLFKRLPLCVCVGVQCNSRIQNYDYYHFKNIWRNSCLTLVVTWEG